MSRDYSGRVYELVEQDTTWPQKFQLLQGQLGRLFGANAVSINHVGSTAVPGLAGKPTLDIAVEVTNLGKADSLNSAMEELGYKSYGAYVAPNSRFFAAEVDGARTVNIHVFPTGHEQLERMVQGIAYLQAHLGEVNKYEALKMALHKQFPDDYGSYRAGKEQYLDELAIKAKRWHDA